ncbi:MAG: GDSL-type esterase/lipase family protein [Nostocoides sp.]
MSVDATGQEFTPSAGASVGPDGRRDVALCFLGDSLVCGFGDPKGQGWVGRVVGRSHHPEVDLTSYNLGVRGHTSADVLTRWTQECPARWENRGERRIVVQVGVNDLLRGISLARHRLNLANLLDEAGSQGIGTFVVGPPPTADAETNRDIEALVDAQADVCGRRNIPFVDCYRPLVTHDQWLSELAASRDDVHPGAAGYGLIAWLVLHGGWSTWLGI